MRVILSSLWLLSCAALSPTWAWAGPDANTLLAHADRARGGGMPGVSWNIELSSRDGDKVDPVQQIWVQAIADASVAETIEPARFKGSKLLQVERNMWLSKPGLSKPIPISPRQRMSGQAANGDIAATNYAKDYQPTLSGEDQVEGEPCYVLELNAKHKRTTYDRIRYWISVQKEVAVKAEFYSTSGKLLKTALFQYGQGLRYNGQTLPFISRMVIKDALTPAETVMTYGKVTVQSIAPSVFDLGQQQ